MGMTALTQIYVRLLDEGVDVWRPVDAECIGQGRYVITSEAPDPETEVWEFNPGEEVLCRTRALSEGEALVAWRRAK